MFEDLKTEIVEHFAHSLSAALTRLDASHIPIDGPDKEAMIAALMPTIIETYAANIHLIERACGFHPTKGA